jgi:acyl dehydratase
MGFKAPILHGLCSYHTAAHALLQTFGSSDPLNMKSFQARFSAPVFPGSTLRTEMWKGKMEDGYQEVIFVVKVDGKPVLSNGRALIKSGATSKL